MIWDGPSARTSMVGVQYLFISNTKAADSIDNENENENENGNDNENENGNDKKSAHTMHAERT